MNDLEFKELKLKIYRLKVELAEAQKEHEKETGRRFVISGPMPKAPRYDDVFFEGLARLNRDGEFALARIKWRIYHEQNITESI